ncbi:MAG TPA: glycoside hydrolase domain-containing protein [Terracidiphilus sp.]|nr:glycoside hydrolase domain-containing protein [Terracidiphilus sp.]
MRKVLSGLAALGLLFVASVHAQNANREKDFAGFDRNDYPGDAALPALRQSFRFTGYFLNNPPGEQQNSWTGKRALLKQNGFGFLVLFTGRLYAQLKGKDAAAIGAEDGKTAVAAAVREGFARGTLIFLDQEEGGRLLAEQATYLFAWADAVRNAGGRAGVYCSAINVPDGDSTISTARDIVERENSLANNFAKGEGAKRLGLWIANDQCPPSPGCALTHPALTAASSGELASSIVAWQYAQSPRRAQFTAACPANYAPDGKCYAAGLPLSASSFVDLNVADSADPSEAP